LAVSACKAHAQNMGKILGKLEKNLKLAFPQAGKKERPSKVEKTGKTGITLKANAEHISETSYNVVLNIRQFMYPSQHSVTLEELRRPSLLEDLSRLKRMVMDFQKALPNLPSRKAPAGRNSK
jgi:hypothetical protein